jgi:hypothetical protein
VVGVVDLPKIRGHAGQNIHEHVLLHPKRIQSRVTEAAAYSGE